MKAFLLMVGLLGSAVWAAESKNKNPAELEQMVRLQIFLDRAAFGPGKIDGKMGEFTEKALKRYRMAKGKGAAPQDTAPAPQGEAAAPKDRPPKSPEKPESKSEDGDAKVAMPDISDLDLKSVDPVFVEYTVTEADVKAVGQVPKTPEEQAKLKWLPYTSVAEGVAERFHMDLDFLEELNAGKTGKLKAGDVVKVVNVEPFELNAVKDLKPGSAFGAAEADAKPADKGAAAKKEKGSQEDKKDKGEKDDQRTAINAAEIPEDKDAPAAEESKISVVITKGENMLEVFDGDKMIAAFPVTVGSDETASPLGDWKVRGVAKLPNFRYDEKMLKEGERSDEFHLLPPGPNCPVGIVWIALNKKGIGVHGTNAPDAIGRNASHGCVRLANWDVVRLAEMVKSGVPVTIR